MRRSGWPAALVMTLLSLTLLQLPAGAAPRAGDWGRFQFDMGNSGFNRFETTLTSGNVAGLTQAWFLPVDRSNPAVVGGTLYQGGRAIDAGVASS